MQINFVVWLHVYLVNEEWVTNDLVPKSAQAEQKMAP